MTVVDSSKCSCCQLRPAIIPVGDCYSVYCIDCWCTWFELKVKNGREAPWLFTQAHYFCF